MVDQKTGREWDQVCRLNLSCIFAKTKALVIGVVVSYLVGENSYHKVFRNINNSRYGPSGAEACLNNENIVIFVNLLTQVTEESIICQTAVPTGSAAVKMEEKREINLPDLSEVWLHYRVSQAVYCNLTITAEQFTGWLLFQSAVVSRLILSCGINRRINHYEWMRSCFMVWPINKHGGERFNKILWRRRFPCRARSSLTSEHEAMWGFLFFIMTKYLWFYSMSCSVGHLCQQIWGKEKELNEGEK